MKNPYVYRDSDVLINKTDIKEKIKLDKFESRISNLALVMLFKSDFKINGTNDIFRSDQILFENVYDSAGKSRTINIYRGEPILNGLSVAYSLCNLMDRYLSSINQRYFKNNNLSNLNKEYTIHTWTLQLPCKLFGGRPPYFYRNFI